MEKNVWSRRNRRLLWCDRWQQWRDGGWPQALTILGLAALIVLSM